MCSGSLSGKVTSGMGGLGDGDVIFDVHEVDTVVVVWQIPQGQLSTSKEMVAGIRELTVIGHLLYGILPPKDEILIPQAVAKLTIVGLIKVRGKGRWWTGQHVELDIEK
jgi:hypothetical protein